MNNDIKEKYFCLFDDNKKNKLSITADDSSFYRQRSN